MDQYIVNQTPSAKIPLSRVIYPCALSRTFAMILRNKLTLLKSPVLSVLKAWYSCGSVAAKAITSIMLVRGIILSDIC